MSAPEIVRGEVAFDEQHRGYRFVATYLQEPKGEALIEIFKGDAVIKSTLWPAYKIWNIAAHADDIVESLEEGLTLAGATGFGGNVYGGQRS